MTSLPAAHAIPPGRKVAGVASLIVGIVASVPLGLFLAAEVGLADTRTVDDNLTWGTIVVTMGAVAIYGGIPAALLAIGLGFVALVRNGRIGKGCGLAGLLLGGAVLVWLAIAVVPQLGGAGFA
ncbi:MAG TPA: hypothetical protein VGO65_00625 [Pseudolysinimonas sp.]|jgi:hypothetical protein|nr:hypothetical protein [Schumannella sp.]HEV7740898.1 hypothetical protein [Pseudolysinimonas sp.]